MTSGGGRGGLLDAIQGHGGVGGLKKVDRSALEQKPVAAEPSNPMAAALAKAAAMHAAWVSGPRAPDPPPELVVEDVGELGYDQYHRRVAKACPTCGGSVDPRRARDGETPYTIAQPEQVFLVQTDFFDLWRTFMYCPICGHCITYIGMDPM